MTDLLGQYAERQFQVMRATHFELPKLWEACTEGLATTGQLLEDVSKELRSAQRDRLGRLGVAAAHAGQLRPSAFQPQSG